MSEPGSAQHRVTVTRGLQKEEARPACRRGGARGWEGRPGGF